ncbi:rRNA cytosine-C5-methylase [Rhodovarius crocodyli]|uniref:rRNA cytosine-C5-methylase n=1 Tax=Rhodovarius crocodyli TaxID=1979269 RepID=A0A437MIJ5_9PROT|nr:transcription antitermination factor NusB [Rhodovarius crocodyli]RVT97477.1 rRNA cytosine-C5-methylase [Rhodovarius crocodyli]
MPSATRQAAHALITAVLQARRPLEEALDALPPMEPRDRAAGHRIAATVLRRLGSLDAVLEPYLQREPPATVRQALRIGAAELTLLGTPPHAAVSDCVSLVPRAFSGLVNAVLRRVASAGAAALEGLDAPRLDTPSWLWTAWQKAHGNAVRRIAEAHQHEAPLDLSLKPGVALPEGATLLPGGTARMAHGTRITELPGFTEGDLWAQDAAAALPARLLAVRPGERALDLCAAPGGKTAQLAAAGAEVVAVERDPKRATRLRENLARLKLPAEVVVADAAAWKPDALFDAILLDAPCTATGTIRRHPDVAHLKRAGDVTKLAETQSRLLAAACALLAPGGRLVFATCSLQAEEGEAHLERVPEGFALDRVRPGELPGMEAMTVTGALRTRPDMLGDSGGMDGFFAMRLRRH